MKKIALGIALVMLLTMAFGVFASAGEGGTATVYLDLFGYTEEDGDITYTGTTDKDGPTDEFGVAVQLETNDVPFCLYKVIVNWDPNVIDYIEYSDVDGDYMDYYEGDVVIPAGGTVTTNDLKTSEGQIIFTNVSGSNFQKKKKDIYACTVGFIYFKPKSNAPANATISITYTEVKDSVPSLIVSEGSSLKFTLNGGVAERTEPLESLGAKVKTDAYAIRFGADFYNLESKADLEVEDLGMLVVSAFRLGEAELTIGSNEYAVKVQARGIENYKDGWKLEDYDKVTFVATVTDIPASHLADVIVARPYVVYSEGDPVYSAAMYRTYNDVLAAADGLFE